MPRKDRPQPGTTGAAAETEKRRREAEESIKRINREDAETQRGSE